MAQTRIAVARWDIVGSTALWVPVLFRCVALLLAASASGLGSDPVAELDRRLASGSTELTYDRHWGYLPALLEALDIPRSSQLLVFSKTSAQFRWISPRYPRAIYFNDEVYVGWVPGGPFLEISVATPRGGGAFYTLRQHPAAKPRFVPDNGSCLQCHESARTLRVPGHLTRSVFPAPDGLPHFSQGTIDVDHRTPIGSRWGGWFVSGNVGMPHRGNAVGPEERYADFASGLLSRPPTDYFDPRVYLTPHSDVVAHLVLAHQTRVHNAIAKAGSEARAALRYRDEMKRLFGPVSESLLASVKRRIERPAEQLVRDLLLAGEAPLEAPVRGTSGFAEEFQQRGLRDARGRSLRDLDLRSRLFRYPCSYLIRSRAYAALPERVRVYVERRIAEILNRPVPEEGFQHLTGRDREAIRQLIARR